MRGDRREGEGRRQKERGEKSRGEKELLQEKRGEPFGKDQRIANPVQIIEEQFRDKRR